MGDRSPVRSAPGAHAISRASGSRSGAGRRMIAGVAEQIVKKRSHRFERIGTSQVHQHDGAARHVSPDLSGRNNRLGQQSGQRGDVLRRRLRQNPVPEIEDKRPAAERRP